MSFLQDLSIRKVNPNCELFRPAVIHIEFNTVIDRSTVPSLLIPQMHTAQQHLNITQRKAN